MAHLVGWEKEVALSFKAAWEKQEQSWFVSTRCYDGFNQRSIEAFKDYTPECLLTEWTKWQEELGQRIQEIGLDRIREKGDRFAWVLDEGEDCHYGRHMRQIEKAIDGPKQGKETHA